MRYAGAMNDWVTSLCVTKDGKIVSGSYDKTVRVWDMQGKELAICRGHESLVYSLCVTKDGKIVSGSYDKTVRVWDMQGKELAICRGHEGTVYVSLCNEMMARLFQDLMMKLYVFGICRAKNLRYAEAMKS